MKTCNASSLVSDAQCMEIGGLPYKLGRLCEDAGGGEDASGRDGQITGKQNDALRMGWHPPENTCVLCACRNATIQKPCWTAQPLTIFKDV